MLEFRLGFNSSQKYLKREDYPNLYKQSLFSLISGHGIFDISNRFFHLLMAQNPLQFTMIKKILKIKTHYNLGQ